MIKDELPLFGGSTFVYERDADRLKSQMKVIRAAMSDGAWHTLAELAERSGYPEASISARIRDLRKPRWGGFEVQREFVRRGLWRYRMWHQ